MTLANPIRVRPYQPDNHVDARGLLVLFVAVILAAAALGFAAHFVSQYFYLILMFPLLIGLGIGSTGAAVIQRTGLRNPLVAAIAGLIGGVLAMLAMHAFDYRTFAAQQARLEAEDPENVALIRSSSDELTFEDDQPINYRAPGERAKRAAAFQLYVQAIRVRSFGQFLDFEARQGVTISSSRSSSQPTNLGYTGSYIYWVVEALIVAGVSLGIMYSRSRSPYCSACRAWKRERPIGYLGGEPKTMAEAVRDGDLTKLRAGGVSFEPTASIIHIAACPNGPACQASPQEDEVRLERRVYDKKGRIVARKTLEHATWPAPSAASIDDLFRAQPPAPPTTT